LILDEGLRAKGGLRKEFRFAIRLLPFGLYFRENFLPKQTVDERRRLLYSWLVIEPL
jgi:hypothetical protein